MCAASLTPPRENSGREERMELIQDLPLGDTSEAMEAAIKSEMPQQAAPTSSAAAPATSAQAQAPVGGVLQQLYEQQQIFAYHAQQAQQAHLNCARLVRSCAAIPEARMLPAQVQRLAALRAAMISVQNSGSSAPTDALPLQSSGGKRTADEPSHPDNSKRQRVGTEGNDSVVVNIEEDVPMYTDDVTGLGLAVPSQVRTCGRTQDACHRWCVVHLRQTPCVNAERGIGTRPEDSRVAHRAAETGSNCPCVRGIGQP
eukprot:COSAG02_NODE_3220_length_7154_cov_12.889157_6_plen_257_part_00